MLVDPRAGKPATSSMLVNVPRLMTAYYTGYPDMRVPAQRVARDPDPPDPHALPAQLIAPDEGEVHWIVDAAAAAAL